MDGNRIDEMISYMNRKYNDSFSYVSTIGQRFGSDIFRIVCSSEKYQDEPVYVTWQKTNNDVLISDNYIGIKFKKATIDLLNQKISSEFGDDFYIQYEVFGSPVYPEYDDNTNLNTFLTDKRSGLSFNALVYCDSKVLLFPVIFVSAVHYISQILKLTYRMSLRQENSDYINTSVRILIRAFLL